MRLCSPGPTRPLFFSEIGVHNAQILTTWRTNMHVLVVEDDAVLADGLSRVLGGHGMAVEVVGNGAQADALLQRAEQTEVVVLDIGLPGMDGYELARRLRATPGLDGVVLIAVTGYGDEQAKQQASAAGFDHHFVKPVDPARLMALVATLA